MTIEPNFDMTDLAIAEQLSSQAYKEEYEKQLETEKTTSKN